MIRVARLLPLSLGVLLACDGAATTSPTVTADVAVLNDAVAELQGIDVQPLGFLDKAVVNTTTDQSVTVAVMNYADFFTEADLETVEFFGAGPLHVDQILRNPDCHIQQVTVYVTDEDGNLIEEGAYTAYLLHFDLDLSAHVGEVVPMCLTGNFTDGSAFPADWCEDVTVKSSGNGSHGGGSGR